MTARALFPARRWGDLGDFQACPDRAFQIRSHPQTTDVKPRPDCPQRTQSEPQARATAGFGIERTIGGSGFPNNPGDDGVRVSDWVRIQELVGLERWKMDRED